MKGTEIIAILSGNMNSIVSAISPVAGAVFTAIFLRNNTAAKEFEKVKAGLLREVAEDLLESGKMTYTEFYKANNFLCVANKADEEYAKMPHSGETSSYDFDWYIRFYEAVGNVSDEKMQLMWAKILAGEINKPNTYSLRTIEVLRNLSKEEADLFSNVCSCCIHIGGHLFLPHYDKYMEKCDISFSQVMFLDELGLISSDSMLILKFPVKQEPSILFMNNSLLITATALDESTKQLMVRQFPFTAVGDELATLINTTLSDENFVYFAKEINSGDSVKISVHKVVSVIENDIQYKEEDIIDNT